MSGGYHNKPTECKAKDSWKPQSDNEVRDRLKQIKRRHKVSQSRGDALAIRRLLELDVLWMVEQIEIRLEDKS